MINWNDYPNFSREEFACSHTGDCEMKKEFMDKLQALRTELGKPMIVTSGYRSPKHPIEARKAKRGEHTYGCAVDIGCSGHMALRVIELGLKHGFKRIGVNQKGELKSRFIHLGIGADGFPFPAIWSY